MSFQLPPRFTYTRRCRACFRGGWLPPHPNDIAIGPRHNGGLSEGADVVLVDLKKVEGDLPRRHMLEEYGLRASGAVRCYVYARLVNHLIQHVDVECDQRTNTTLFNCGNGVFC